MYTKLYRGIRNCYLLLIFKMLGNIIFDMKYIDKILSNNNCFSYYDLYEQLGIGFIFKYTNANQLPHIITTEKIDSYIQSKMKENFLSCTDDQIKRNSQYKYLKRVSKSQRLEEISWRNFILSPSLVLIDKNSKTRKGIAIIAPKKVIYC